MAFTNEHIIISAIIERQQRIGLTNEQLINGVMNTTQWWRIRHHKAEITLTHALQLLSRVNLIVKIYQPELIVLNDASYTQAKETPVAKSA